MTKKKAVDVQNSSRYKRGTYTEALERISAAGHCPFCKNHLAEHHSQPILLEGRYWSVTKNAWPYKGTRHHFLFIAKLHAERIEDLSSRAWNELHTLIAALSRKRKLKGGTFMLRSGKTELTGATVSHLHAHFIVGGPRASKAAEIRAVVGFEKK